MFYQENKIVTWSFFLNLPLSRQSTRTNVEDEVNQIKNDDDDDDDNNVGRILTDILTKGCI